MTHDDPLQALIEKVQANPKYQPINQALVRRLCEQALLKGLTGKLAVKAVRNKLHQVGGAYFKRNIHFGEAEKALSNLPTDLQSADVRQFCIQTMEAHSSSAERLSILDHFFTTCLAPLAPVTSIIDLACGLNPFAIPWMPLAQGFDYLACDIYQDMLHLVDRFFEHFNLNGEALSCDLLGNLPQKSAQVGFLLKSIPCLEQMDKDITLPILQSIQTEHLLVSFPVRSLGGRDKGMVSFYRERFIDSISQQNWEVQEFEFPTELAFLVTK